MNDEIIHIKLAKVLGTDISSRSRAAHLRSEIFGNFESIPRRVVFDFENVRSISGSFADELFAVLVQDYGDTWFKEHIGVLNLPDLIRQTILEAINERMDDEKRTCSLD